MTVADGEPPPGPPGPPGPSGPAASASERVADEIRTWMFAQGLEPGDRLGREEDLAARFGVSRPTLREALRALSTANLVRASKGPGGGIFVAATASDGIGRTVTRSIAGMLAANSIDIRELLETRVLLEVPLAGMAAARADDTDLGRLRALAGPGRDGEPASRATIEAIDERLHAEIARIAGNRLAGALMQWVGEVLQPRLYDLVAGAVVEEVVLDQHAELVDAIARGDRAAAERAMREHLVYINDVVAAVLASAPAPGVA